MIFKKRFILDVGKILNMPLQFIQIRIRRFIRINSLEVLARQNN